MTFTFSKRLQQLDGLQIKNYPYSSTTLQPTSIISHSYLSPLIRFNNLIADVESVHFYNVVIHTDSQSNEKLVWSTHAERSFNCDQRWIGEDVFTQRDLAARRSTRTDARCSRSMIFHWRKVNCKRSHYSSPSIDVGIRAIA